ncbi:hypothetical protein [Nocardia rhizosphaerae]|uniref:PPE family protein n=1 Tax=Nocardia rhizosphaerae TaxID=1691571 RepID=A0ABV8L5R1_9NOCA
MADGGGSSLVDVLSATQGIPLGTMVSGRQQQLGAEQQQESVSHGGVDPAYISDFEAFEGLSHEEIYHAVQQMQPGVMQQFGDQWVSMFNEISGAVTGLIIQTSRAAASLEGEFAAAGQAAGQRFITEASDVYTVLSVVGHRVKAAAYGAEAVKIAVPAPVSSGEGAATGSSVPATLVELAVPGEAATVEQEKEAKRLEAIAAMNATYKPSYGPAGESVPAFVAPTQPGTVDTTDPGNGGGGSNTGGTGGGSSTDTSTTTEDPGTTEDTTTGDDTTGDDTTGDDTTTAGADDDNSGTDDSQDDDSTNAASTTPSTTTPGTTTPGAGTPGTGPGGGSPGAGSPGSSPGATLGPGGSIAGRTSTIAGQNLTAAGGSGTSSGTRGMSPGMMGAPGARGAGKDDEDEHQAPDYLRGVQPELFGDEQPAVPQAIGADAPSTRLAEQTGDPGAT